MGKEKYSFRITPKEAIDKYSIGNTSNIALDEELSQKFTTEAVEKAKQLKAKHGTKYSDAYYLDYAKSLELQEAIGTSKEINKNRLAFCEIKDIDWAGFSYEEILGMESNGYKIPEEILQWAHAQQEADVTDYVMVSDATALEDNTTAATGSSKDELANLQKKARQNIAKADQAIEDATQSVKEYNFVSDKAKKIKKDKEKNFKNTMDEISSLTQEWKKLDDKKNSGKLTKLEEKKYNQLTKKLNGSDGSLIKEIQVDSSDLEGFLKTLNGLNEDISENLKLAQETIQSGRDLGDYEKNYNEAQLPVATSGIVCDGNGLSTDSLYGVKGDEIAELAVEKGSELDDFSTSLSTDLTTGDNAKLTEFATEFTQAASQAESETKNALGDKYAGEETDKENNQQKKKDKPVKNFEVSMGFSSQKSILATATTILSTADIITRDNTVNKDDRELRKEIRTAQKDAKALSQEVSKAEEKLTKNQTEEDAILAQLNALQEETEATTPTTPVALEQKVETRSTEVKNQNNQIENKKEAEPKPQTPEQPENDNKAGEQQTLVAQVTQKQEETQALKSDVVKATSKSARSTSKGQKLTKELTGKNDKLTTRNKNGENVSKDTTIVGAGTVAKGFVDTAIGTSLQSTGMVLMASPFTWSNGVVLFTLGMKLQTQGEKEIAYGSVAVGTGVMGLTVNEATKGTTRHTNTTIKEANQLFRENSQSIKEASEVSGTQAPSAQGEAQGENKNNGEAQTPVEENKTEQPATRASQNSPTPETTTPELTLPTTEAQTPVEENNTVENKTTTEQIPTENNIEQENNDENNTDKASVENKTTETNPTQNEETQTQQETTDQTQTDPSQEQEQQTETQATQANQQTSDKKEDKKEADVEMEFNAQNAVKATATTISETSNMVKDERSMNRLTHLVRSQTSQSETLIKNIDSETAKAVMQHEANLAEANAISNQHAATQTEIQAAQTQEEALAAQTKMTNLSTQLDSAATKDEQITTIADKTISNSVRQLSQFRNNTKTMNTDLSALDKTISNQFDVSAKTTAVGIGTIGVGALNINKGAGLILSGMSLLANPFTTSLGTIQIAAGQLLTAKGMTEIASGTVATATGTAGAVANAVTNAVSKDSDSVLKAANAKNSELERKAGESANTLGEDIEAPEQTNTSDEEVNTENLPQNQTEEGEENEYISSITQLSASATANANITESIFTDDKVDKKLSRFNTESMIESKKKMKKVQAVSASSGGRA